jgi:Uma2 family endonuclease
MRMTYLDGNLTILLPGYRNDIGLRQLYMLLTTVFVAWRINFMMIGGTTLRRPGLTPMQGAGKEPDDGFYLGKVEAKMRNKQELDLTIDPPPSLVIDVHDRADSEFALPTYARLGVPEVWLYNVSERTLWFGRLARKRYQKIERSLGVPRLTPTLVLDALDEHSKSMGSLKWHKWLDAWAKTLPEPPEGGR